MRRFVIPFIAVALAVSACGDLTSTSKDQNVHDHSVPSKADSASVSGSYRCPMKCEGSESEKPGKCPVCKMDLMAVEHENAKQ